jgi:hypothetical protein
MNSQFNEPGVFKICNYCREEKPFNDIYFLQSMHSHGKCKKCNHKIIGNKIINDFFENILDDTWACHVDYPDYYFERDTDKIFNVVSGKYIVNHRTVSNITKRKTIEIKWEAFHGKITENKIIKFINGDSLALTNVTCDYIHCEVCDTIVENATTRSVYCSRRCQLNNKNKHAKTTRNNELETYIFSKISNQKILNKKYNIQLDYDKEYLISLGKKCSYCEIECIFGNEKESLSALTNNEHNNSAIDDADTLTFDRKDSTIGYCKENINVCCWFCNRMKNTTDYSDWLSLIEFVKGKKHVLDISNKSFGRVSTAIDISNVYTGLKRSSPTHYPDQKDPKKTFLALVKKQNFKDAIFNFFPIVYLDQNCLFNASIDAIDPSIEKENKHRPDNIQIIPKFLNYGKYILSTEQFLKEWEKRNFRTDFTDCSIQLPAEYNDKSYFNKFIKIKNP